MKQEIDQALFAAQFVQNPWYPVAEPSDAQASADMLMLPAILPLNS